MKKILLLEVDGGDEVSILGAFTDPYAVRRYVEKDMEEMVANDDVECRMATDEEAENAGEFSAIYYPAFKEAPSDESMEDSMGALMFLQYRVTVVPFFTNNG